MRTILAFLFLNTYIFGFANQDSVVVRGPYLQAGTDTSIVIQFRTEADLLCEVRCSTNFGQLSSVESEATLTKEHSISIGNLLPFTKYFYSIYTGNQLLAGDDSSYYFTTNPVKGTVQPIHGWVTGDMGRANQQQKDVRDAYWSNIKAGKHTDAWLWLGDNVYSSGTDSQYQEKLFDIYPEVLRNTVSRPCPGNHDYGSVDALTNNGPYYQNFTMTTKGEAGGVPSNEEGYYSFDYGNVHFISLNSEVLLWYLASNSQMCNWLKNDLQNTNQPWKIAYWHQPPYTKGSHDSDDLLSNMYFMRTNIVPMLEQYGVDLVLTGHSHNHERSYPIHGHYGSSSDFYANMQVSATSGKQSENAAYTKNTTGPDANKGTIYIVCGNGGSTTSGETLNHPIMYYSQQDSAGFMTIDVNGMQLDARYYDSHGNLWDDFTIHKTSANPSGAQSLEEVIGSVEVSPNPFNTEFSLELEPALTQDVEIDFLEISGRLIQRVFEGTLTPGKKSFTVYIYDLPPANYLIRINGKQRGSITKLVNLQRTE